jgi:hypothetical protein
MKKWPLLSLLLLPSLLSANPFLSLETAHNLGKPMTEAMTERAAARWEPMFAAGRGVGTFTNIRMSQIDPSIGVADWGWHLDGKVQNGQLIVQTVGGKIDIFYYTEKPAKRRNTAMEGQAADSASTALGLSMGAVEGNPLLAGMSGPAIAAVKLGVGYAVQNHAPLDSCAGYSFVAGPLGYGAAAWNGALLLGYGAAAATPVATIAMLIAHLFGEDPIWQCIPKDLLPVSVADSANGRSRSEVSYFAGNAIH